CLAQMEQLIFPGAVFGYQPGLAAPGADAPLDHGQRLRGGDTQKDQAPASEPGMPGPAGAPEALQPVAGALDVVTFDYEFPPSQGDAGYRTAASVLEQRLVIEGAVRVRQQGGQEFLLAAQHTGESAGGARHCKLAAIAQGLVEKLLQALVPSLGGGNAYFRAVYLGCRR